MDAILAILGFGSMGLFVIGVLIMIIQLIRKKSIIIPGSIMGISVIIFVVSFVLTAKNM